MRQHDRSGGSYVTLVAVVALLAGCSEEVRRGPQQADAAVQSPDVSAPQSPGLESGAADSTQDTGAPPSPKLDSSAPTPTKDAGTPLTPDSTPSPSQDAGQPPTCGKYGPNTSLHYASGASSSASTALGFNLVDVSSPSELSSLPSNVKALVWLGMCNGADSTFISAVNAWVGNPQLFGFYLMDEPDPTGQWNPTCPVANLKAESDYIHTNIPGAKTFIIMMDMGSSSSPSFANTYNPANTGIDLYGIDPYPCRTNLGGCDFTIIGPAVNAALANGIPLSAIVPVYQAFGGGGWVTDTGGSYLFPSVAQEQQLLATWAPLVPTPVFDYVYAWGSQNGDTALESSPTLQQVFAAQNAACP